MPKPPTNWGDVFAARQMERLGAYGHVVSVCYGPTSEHGTSWTVAWISSAGVERDMPAAALTFGHAVAIAVHELDLSLDTTQDGSGRPARVWSNTSTDNPPIHQQVEFRVAWTGSACYGMHRPFAVSENTDCVMYGYGAQVHVPFGARLDWRPLDKEGSDA